MLILAVFPLALQLIFYIIGRLVFRKSAKPKIFSACTVLNALVCSAVSFKMIFLDEYDNPLGSLSGYLFAVSCGIVILIMIIIRMILNKKLKNNDTEKGI